MYYHLIQLRLEFFLFLFGIMVSRFVLIFHDTCELQYIHLMFLILHIDIHQQQTLPSTYLYDSTSGFYYDTLTGLYYDPKTQVRKTSNLLHEFHLLSLINYS